MPARLSGTGGGRISAGSRGVRSNLLIHLDVLSPERTARLQQVEENGVVTITR